MTPTAKELFYQNNKKEFWDNGTVEDYILPTMIEFAKLHVEVQAKEIVKKAKIDFIDGLGGEGTKDIGISEISVLNAYPLNNIN